MLEEETVWITFSAMSSFFPEKKRKQTKNNKWKKKKVNPWMTQIKKQLFYFENVFSCLRLYRLNLAI